MVTFHIKWPLRLKRNCRDRLDMTISRGTTSLSVDYRLLSPIQIKIRNVSDELRKTANQRRGKHWIYSYRSKSGAAAVCADDAVDLRIQELISWI